MLRVYTRRFPGLPLLPLLFPNLGPEPPPKRLFAKRAFEALRDPLVEVTPDPREAEVFLLAHNFAYVWRRRAELERFASDAARYRKRLLVFWHGDGSGPTGLEDPIVFRTSLHRDRRRAFELAMPGLTEDLLGGEPLHVRPHRPRPIVAFCGRARAAGLLERLRLIARDRAVRAASATLGEAALLDHRPGISIRAEALASLAASPLVEPRFILRANYGGDPGRSAGLREEYRANLRDSDLALCLRGDGNFSFRFYDALSLGRVPVLLDTGCVLPFEDTIDYDAFVLRLPVSRLSHLPELVRRWWDRLDSDRFAHMQRLARAAYERHLSPPAFFRRAVEVVTRLLPNLPAA